MGLKGIPVALYARVAKIKRLTPMLQLPSRMQQRSHKVRKSASQVVLGSMRIFLSAVCRTVLCGRCTLSSSDQENSPHLLCRAISGMRGVIGLTNLHGYASNVCTSPTASKMSALTKIFRLQRMPQCSCTSCYPDLLIKGYHDHIKRL